ncbi:MAG: hypothetical protein ACI92Z_001805, partial [Paracoccaceae bacterium]
VRAKGLLDHGPFCATKPCSPIKTYTSLQDLSL